MINNDESSSDVAKKYIRYKSLCLGLLGQLKKMHIQLPMLYVVKVLASSPHNFVLLPETGSVY